MSQIASALRYLHENHIVHGNLRAEHVNVVDPCQVKITVLTVPLQLNLLNGLPSWE